MKFRNAIRSRTTLTNITNVMILSAIALFLGGKNSPVRSAYAGWKADRQSTRYIRENWDNIGMAATRLGDKTRPAVVTMFTDYHCRYCQQADRYIDSVLHAEPDLAIAVRYLPVSGALGQRSAQAALCAADQNAFAKMSAGLYGAAELSSEPDYASIAKAAGVQDQSAFARCMSNPLPGPRVSADIELAQRIGIAGTPAFVLRDGTVGRLKDLPNLISTLQRQ